jgi:hypothetical protein
MKTKCKNTSGKELFIKDLSINRPEIKGEDEDFRIIGGLYYINFNPVSKGEFNERLRKFDEKRP